MLGNGIQQTTATTGTGNLTLATASGYAAFSNVFQVGQQFAYGLLDSGGKLIEEGFGYLSDATTLVRTRPTATWNGTTYVKESVTAASLTGTTTVICTPHAATLASALPTVDGQSAGIQRFITSGGRGLSFSPADLSGLTIYYVPFILRTGAPIVSLAYNVTVAHGILRCGIYDVNEKGYPGKLLATTGDLDGSTTGLKVGTLSAPLALPPGDYFTAVVTASAGAGGTSYTTNGSAIMGGMSLGFISLSPYEFRTQSVASAVFPTTASTTTTGIVVGSAHPPCVFVGVA